MQQQEGLASDLEENREEFAAAMKEAERVKESCRSVSVTEINDLQGMAPTLLALVALHIHTC